MWKVEFESTSAQAESESLLSGSKLSDDDRRVITTWIRQVTFHGPESIQGDGKWADHALEDDWVGYRSSAFSNSGRIIYRIEKDIVKVQIARITTNHNYGRKK
ncbi:MAG: hypothetical protein ABIQ95_00515 [Bdellovibrionia bacterium]